VSFLPTRFSSRCLTQENNPLSCWMVWGEAGHHSNPSHPILALTLHHSLNEFFCSISVLWQRKAECDPSLYGTMEAKGMKDIQYYIVALHIKLSQMRQREGFGKNISKYMFLSCTEKSNRLKNLLKVENCWEKDLLFSESGNSFSYFDESGPYLNPWVRFFQISIISSSSTFIAQLLHTSACRDGKKERKSGK